MALDPISAALDLGTTIIERIWPDKTQQDAAKLELLKMQANGELARITAQTDEDKAQAAVNQAEASNPSLFVAGWRPAVGWVCAAGLASQFLIGPYATWAAALFGKTAAVPPLDMGTLLTLLLGMLGIGALRTAEKFKGVAAQ